MLVFLLVILLILAFRVANLLNLDANTNTEIVAVFAAIALYLGLIVWDIFLIVRLFHGQ